MVKKEACVLERKNCKKYFFKFVYLFEISCLRNSYYRVIVLTPSTVLLSWQSYRIATVTSLFHCNFKFRKEKIFILSYSERSRVTSSFRDTKNIVKRSCCCTWVHCRATAANFLECDTFGFKIAKYIL